MLKYVLRTVITQARGLRKHMKRLNAPKHWMLDKLGGAFVCLMLCFCLNLYKLPFVYV